MMHILMIRMQTCKNFNYKQRHAFRDYKQISESIDKKNCNNNEIHEELRVYNHVHKAAYRRNRYSMADNDGQEKHVFNQKLICCNILMESFPV